MQNEEADDLTNWDFTKFRPENRVDVNLSGMKFGVLHRLLETGEAYFNEIEDAKRQAKARSQGLSATGSYGTSRRKKLKGGSLKETDPW